MMLMSGHDWQMHADEPLWLPLLGESVHAAFCGAIISDVSLGRQHREDDGAGDGSDED